MQPFKAQAIVEQKKRHKFIDKIHVKYVEREKRYWAVAANTEIYEEAVAALTMLGFAQAPSQKVTAQILKEEPDAPVEKVIKLALKRL